MTTLITTWLAFNAGAATVVLWRYWCERRMDRDADLCAVMDATREPVPSAPTGDDLIYHRIVAEIVEQSADERTCLYGDADFDEWAVEMHPSNWGGEDE